MKNTFTRIAARSLLAGVTALTAATGVTSALAAGSHGGGHAHGAGHEAQAIGQPGVAAQVSRTVQVDMSDAMRFTPAQIRVSQGETIRFVVKNSGRVAHEFVLGTAQDLKAHYEVMKKSPEMEHADDNMLSVKPGQSGELLWKFTQAGPVAFACLHPGHYDAGMKGAVMVVPARAGAGQAPTAMQPVADTGAASPSAPQSQAADMKAMDLSEGEVRKIDREAQKITLRHGEIKNLDMPPMTMVFRVADAALLDAAQVGQKVRFSAEKRGGALVITTLERSE